MTAGDYLLQGKPSLFSTIQRTSPLVTVEHPLGVIKITRKKTGFELRLEEL
jgi:hypothetical protein